MNKENTRYIRVLADTVVKRERVGFDLFPRKRGGNRNRVCSVLDISPEVFNLQEERIRRRRGHLAAGGPRPAVAC